ATPAPVLLYGPRLYSLTLNPVAVTPACLLASLNPPNWKSVMPGSPPKTVAKLPDVKDRFVSSGAIVVRPIFTVAVTLVTLGSTNARNPVPVRRPLFTLTMSNVAVPLVVTCVVVPAVQTVGDVQDM